MHTTLYDGNINAFENQLLLGKTYVISNAIVKDTKPEYKALNDDFQWAITGKTRIQDLNENNMEFLFSTYTFTHFDQLEKYMDSNDDISSSLILRFFSYLYLIFSFRLNNVLSPLLFIGFLLYIMPF